MKRQLRIAKVAGLALIVVAGGAMAQGGFSSGSDGSDGALVVSTSTTLQVPPDGIFNFTTVDVQGGTLKFTPNALNTPIYILATGDITVSVDFPVNTLTHVFAWRR